MKKKYFLALAASLLLGISSAAFIGAEPLTADAAESEPTTTSSSSPTEEDWTWHKYGLIGTFTDPRDGQEQGWDINTTLPFGAGYQDGETTWYDITVYLEEGDLFKAYYPETDTYMGANGCSDEIGLNSAYFGWSDGGNWIVKESGMYSLSIIDGLETYGEHAYGWRGGEKVETATGTINYYHGGEIIFTAEAPIGTYYTPTWQYQDGYVLNGWYSDPELTTPITSIKVEETNNVYGDYSPAGADLVVYFEGTYTHAYAWNNTSGAMPVAWPGAEMTPVEYAYNQYVKMVVIPAEYQADRIIFNDNADNQTDNLTLDPALVEADTYTIWGNDGGWWTAEESADRSTAMEMMNLWATEVRRINDDICWMVDNAEAWERLKSAVASLSEGAYDLLYNAPDTVEGVTIGQSYEYLSNLIEGTGSAAGYAPFSGDMTSEDVALIVGISLLALSAAGAAIYFFYRKKKANRA